MYIVLLSLLSIVLFASYIHYLISYISAPRKFCI